MYSSENFMQIYQDMWLNSRFGYVYRRRNLSLVPTGILSSLSLFLDILIYGLFADAVNISYYRASIYRTVYYYYIIKYVKGSDRSPVR